MIARFPYVTPQGVLCKGCGRKIAGPPGPVLAGGLIEAEYVDLILEMEYPNGDHDQHSTPMCRGCATVVTVQDAEDLYLADLAEWSRDVSPRPDVRAWMRRMVTRRPIGVHAV